MPEHKKTFLRSTVGGQQAAILSDTKSRKKATRIALPVAHVNIEEVRSFMHEYMVPLLAEEFLRRRDCTKNPQCEVTASESDFRALEQKAGL